MATVYTTLESLPPLVTATDLANASNGNLTADAPGVADRAAEVTDLLRTLAGWHVAPLLEHTVYAEPIGGHLPLPTLRLVEVKSVQNDDGAAVQWTSKSRTGSISVTPGCDELAVGIVDGFDAVPPALKRIGVQVALRALTSPMGVTREQIGQHSVSPALTGTNVSGQLVVLEAEEAVLARYTLPSLA